VMASGVSSWMVSRCAHATRSGAPQFVRMPGLFRLDRLQLVAPCGGPDGCDSMVPGMLDAGDGIGHHAVIRRDSRIMGTLRS